MILLISPVDENEYKSFLRPIVKDNYRVGWLHVTGDGGIYLAWGMSASKDKAMGVYRELEVTQGHHELWDCSIPVKRDTVLTLMELEEIKGNSKITI